MKYTDRKQVQDVLLPKTKQAPKLWIRVVVSHFFFFFYFKNYILNNFVWLIDFQQGCRYH